MGYPEYHKLRPVRTRLEKVLGFTLLFVILGGAVGARVEYKWAFRRGAIAGIHAVINFLNSQQSQQPDQEPQKQSAPRAPFIPRGSALT
jgi:hypothetical protein